MKKVWWSTIGIAAYVLFRFAALAMKHPDWKADDWIQFLSFVLLAAAVLSILVWGVKKLRTPKTVVAKSADAKVAAEVPATQIPVNAQTDPESVRPTPMPQTFNRCSACGTEFDSTTKFCCDCGHAVA